MPIPSSVVRAFTPTGRLRASINLGNRILAHRDANGQPAGVSVDLAREFGKRIGAEVELVPFDVAIKSVECVGNDQADIGFFAIDPKRGEHIAFTAPYVLIEGAYVVRNDSPLQANEEVDRAGTTVVVGEGSAYDLYLTRELKQAKIVRVAGGAAMQTFQDTGAQVVAGVKQMIAGDAARIGGLRLLPGRFMVIRQAMGCPRTRGDDAAKTLAAFVEEMKASGFVAEALQRHGIEGAGVAPAGD